ncbi:MAG: DUF3795 domain-containing protein [Ruminococcaceae bacterium]|nr:DUF3795 domain-containing protein [Oscillospiraceae bacterium]
MSTICKIDCGGCGFKDKCRGCAETGGRPLGGECVAAECIKAGGETALAEYKAKVIAEFNALKIEGMPEITGLVSLCGAYVNLAYPMPNGQQMKLLDDSKVYLGTQVECDGSDKCFGLVAGTDFLLVSRYEAYGANPELILFRKR